MRKTGTVAAIVPAAGSGSRFGSSDNKIWAPLCGRTVVEWAVQALAGQPRVDAVVVVAAQRELERARATCRAIPKLYDVVVGGATRAESVWAGLRACPPGCGIVLVHDAARPLLGGDTVDRVLDGIAEHRAAAPGLRVSDTVKRVRDDGSVSSTVEREGLWTVQTPQGATRDLLEMAYAAAPPDGGVPTDECSLLERAGVSPQIVMGDPCNIKITVPGDLALAEELLSARIRRAAPFTESRTGMGFDVHRLAEGRPLWLSGVHIDHPRGLEGHSDADVVMHAVCDAILGAVCAGDIGLLFPDTDPANKDRRSRDFVSGAVARAAASGWRLTHLDVTLAADEPRIGLHRQAMRGALAAAASVGEECISIKATTCEGLGFVGRREGVACWAVATVARHAPPARQNEDEGGL